MALASFSTAPRLRSAPASPGCDLRRRVSPGRVRPGAPMVLPPSASVTAPLGRRRRPGSLAVGVWQALVPPLPLALAALLVAFALGVAPEQPRDQEAICQRQAGVEACRVW